MQKNQSDFLIEHQIMISFKIKKKRLGLTMFLNFEDKDALKNSYITNIIYSSIRNKPFRK